MDNLVRRFFSNGTGEEVLFNVYQGPNKNAPYLKLTTSPQEINNPEIKRHKTLKRQDLQIEGVKVTDLNNDLSNVSIKSNPLPNPNVIPNLHSTPEVS